MTLLELQVHATPRGYHQKKKNHPQTIRRLSLPAHPRIRSSPHPPTEVRCRPRAGAGDSPGQTGQGAPPAAESVAVQPLKSTVHDSAHPQSTLPGCPPPSAHWRPILVSLDPRQWRPLHSLHPLALHIPPKSSASRIASIVRLLTSSPPAASCQLCSLTCLILASLVAF